MKQSVKISKDTSGRITVAFAYDPQLIAKYHPKNGSISALSDDVNELSAHCGQRK
jgi:hypothetical protein